MQAAVIHTNHSRKRCQQRGVTQQMIDDTVAFGDMIRKQGLRFYIMTEKCLHFFHKKQYNERVKNTVVVMSEDNVVLTVYKDSGAMKHIKKKRKSITRWKKEEEEE